MCLCVCSGCPSCMRPLPRCALCLVSLDCATPSIQLSHAQLKHHMHASHRKGGGGGADRGGGEDDGGEDGAGGGGSGGGGDDTKAANTNSADSKADPSGSGGVSAAMKSKFDDTSSQPFSTW